MSTNAAEIYGLLLSMFFFLQLWHIPLTWVFALLCGACMPNICYSLTATHVLNLIGVVCNFYLSRTFLKRIITSNDRMRGHLDNF